MMRMVMVMLMLLMLLILVYFNVADDQAAGDDAVSSLIISNTKISSIKSTIRMIVNRWQDVA